ncbi:lysophospholipase L1 and related esterase-like protein [Paenibacillus alvei TS-15]|uniref:Lysophospholipase L1 and related esterase-like protein n=2 Tax=Paenibacillus TaxID=44249 RepID=S9U1W4_PAEAL|nr:hypothetical protein [Paenibacillus alvei]EPY04495.1 lysophospholipase L1 and related esterase-like protein [Paenibacillus alvei TS-15]
MEPMLHPQWMKLVQTQHPEKVLSYVRHLDDRLIAAIYGMDAETYLDIKARLVQQARQAAVQVLS